ncbi:MAG: FecR domain-containing protein [Spirochaetota bacterium]
MKNHPDKKQLIDFSLHALNEKDTEAVAAHIIGCEECKGTVRSLNVILKMSDNSALAPSPHIKSRVISLATEAENKMRGRFSFRSILTRPVMFVSVSLIIVLSAIIYIIQKPQTVSKDVMLALTQHNGITLHNDAPLQKDNIFINSGIIKTKEFSSAALGIDTVLSIKIAENTELDIKEARENTGIDSTRYIISIDMRSGTVFAESVHNVSKKFTITTKHAVYEALGTGFIISSDNITSKLSVLDGTVRATLKAEEKSIVLTKGEGCIADTTLQKINISSENELKQFNILFNKANEIKLMNDVKNKSTEMINNQDQDYKENTSDNNISSQDKQKSDEVKQSKTEIRNENRQIQKEMRNNIRSGKRSQR